MQESFVKFDIVNKVGYITFYHPQSNSFPSKQLNELVQVINELSGNNEVHVLVLKSEGKTFCAGASFDELLTIQSFDEGKQFFSGFANVINALRKSNKIVIAQVQGKAVGGGVGIISACEYAIATEEASIKLSEFAIGIGPFVIEPVVSKKIGQNAMSQLTLAAQEWKDAKWAFDKGLFAKIVNSNNLSNEVVVLAEQLASYNPEALLEMKKILWKDCQNWDELLIQRAEISGKLVLSDFTVKALSKFKKGN